MFKNYRFTDGELEETWRSYFASEGPTGDIYASVSTYPDERSIYIDWDKLDSWSHELAMILLREPQRAIERANFVIMETARGFDEDFHEKISIRIFNLPPFQTYPLRKLGSANVGELVRIEGSVLNVRDSAPRLIGGRFKCAQCRAVHYVYQKTFIVNSPSVCEKEKGGCGAYNTVARFELLMNDSDFEDHQKIIIQEPPELLRDGRSPRKIDVLLDNDLTENVRNGDKVIITGIYETAPVYVGGKTSTITSTFIKAINIEVENDTSYEEISFSEDEVQAFRKLSTDPELYDKAIGTLAPSIWGHETAKLTLIFQLFNGVTSTMPDGTVNRGRIHSLLLGDPGLAKSRLLEAWVKLAPRGMYVTSKGLSGPGLAGAVKRTATLFGSDKYDVEAGALVLANNGNLALDEFSDLEKADQAYLNESMERGTVTIFKADVRLHLPASTTISIAGNPKGARFSGRDAETVINEMDLPADILSRIDVIILYFDEFDENKDRKIMDHILNNRTYGQILRSQDNARTSSNDEILKKMGEKASPLLDPEFFRKYIAYSNINCFPVFTEEAIEILRGFYLEVRGDAYNSGSQAVPVTPRFLGSLMRLSEASAKVRLSDKIEAEDAFRAKEIIQKTLAKLFPSGKIDWGLIETGLSMRERQWVSDIKVLAVKNTKAEIEKIMEEEELKPDQIKKIMDQAIDEGVIFADKTLKRFDENVEEEAGEQ